MRMAHGTNWCSWVLTHSSVYPYYKSLRRTTMSTYGAWHDIGATGLWCLTDFTHNAWHMAHSWCASVLLNVANFCTMYVACWTQLGAYILFDELSVCTREIWISQLFCCAWVSQLPTPDASARASTRNSTQKNTYKHLTLLLAHRVLPQKAVTSPAAWPLFIGWPRTLYPVTSQAAVWCPVHL
jgi:hypothetical protein